MRIIKFRAWNDINGMSEPFTLHDLQSGKVRLTDECQVKQFTGRQDKNGVDIYEGDRLIFDVKKDNDVPGSQPIKHQGGVAAIDWLGLSFGAWIGYYCENVVVIGDVFKNPSVDINE